MTTLVEINHFEELDQKGVNMKHNKLETEDDELFDKIKKRIRWDIRVSNSDILLKVKNGCVVLFGYFDKPFRHAAAVDIISTTKGLKSFEDKSQVLDDYFRTDTEIEMLISKQILSLSLLLGEWLNVNVCDGVAKLEGHVFRPRLKAFAARAAWELSGIRDCINLIEVREFPVEVIDIHPARYSVEMNLVGIARVN